MHRSGCSRTADNAHDGGADWRDCVVASFWPPSTIGSVRDPSPPVADVGATEEKPVDGHCAKHESVVRY